VLHLLGASRKERRKREALPVYALRRVLKGGVMVNSEKGLVAIGLALALGGCSRSSASRAAPDAAKSEVTFQLYVRSNNLAPPPEGLAVVLDGKVLGNVSEKGERSVPFSASESTMGVDLAPRIKARLTTTCGQEDFAVRPYYSARGEEQEFRDKYATPTSKTSMSFFVEGIQETMLYIDNVGGKARTLTVGTTEVAIPADAPLQKRVRLGRCATANRVVIDGTRAGELATARPNPKSIPAALIDAVGARCYRKVVHVYKLVGTTTSTGTPPPSEKLSGARVYAIGHPTDFLEASPKDFVKVVMPDDISMPSDQRIELNRCPGTPKRGGKLL
jgi:hypothetical protein